ncbi:MAG: hypothetical protein RL095_578 [Verrucomicrobiota bacterium]|jgi:MoxR-like ATPase
MSKMHKEVLKDHEAREAAAKSALLVEAMERVLIGQSELVKLTVNGVLARGHILLEGLPGLGKTELVKGLSKALGLSSRRIQFTPDLLPGDITGTAVLQEHEGQRNMVFNPGPIFANVVMADEINRASPKTQSAMLEAMQEHCVTSMGVTRRLPEPFFVLATQNPIELEGTYPLPEAQMDRFLFKLDIRQGGPEALQRIVMEREMGISPEVPQVMNAEDFTGLLALSRRVHLPEVLAAYIARLVDASHPGRSKAAEGVRYGASPRAALAFATAIKARALMQGRIHAGFDDVRALAVPILAHRILLDYRARLEGQTSRDIVLKLLEEIKPAEISSPSVLK